MKSYIKSTIIFTTILFLSGCTHEEDSKPSEKHDFLPEGLESLEFLSLNDQRLATAVKSLDEQFNNKNEKLFLSRRGNVKAARLFSYHNGSTAVAFSFENDDNYIFTQILRPESDKEVDFILAQIVHLDPGDRSKTSIYFNSLKFDRSYAYNPGSNISVYGWGSWGKCMENAMDKLFYDWEEAPFATFGCWVFSPFCVIGAGLGCLVKEIT